MKNILIAVLCAACILSGHKAWTSDEKFIETLELHHAHIENEFRVNSAFRENLRDEETDADTGETNVSYKDVFETMIEMGLASPDKRLGIEAHIPFTNEGENPEDGRIFGLGDMEIEPIRVALVNEPSTVWTASLGFVLPTGDKQQGAGEGRTFVEPHLLLDKTWERWYFGANLIPGFELGGEHEKTLGWGTAAAYSWEQALCRCDIAGSIEVSGESSLSAAAEGLDIIRVTPGIHLHLSNGWRIRLGLRLPLTEDRQEERAFLFQAGVHLGHE